MQHKKSKRRSTGKMSDEQFIFKTRILIAILSFVAAVLLIVIILIKLDVFAPKADPAISDTEPPVQAELMPFDQLETFDMPTTYRSETRPANQLTDSFFDSVDEKVTSFKQAASLLGYSVPEPKIQYIVSDINADGYPEETALINFGSDIRLIYCDSVINKRSVAYSIDHEYRQFFEKNSSLSQLDWKLKDYLMLNKKTGEITIAYTILPDIKNSADIDTLSLSLLNTQNINTWYNLHIGQRDKNYFYSFSLYNYGDDSDNSAPLENYLKREGYYKGIEELKGIFSIYEP